MRNLKQAVSVCQMFTTLSQVTALQLLEEMSCMMLQPDLVSGVLTASRPRTGFIAALCLARPSFSRHQFLHQHLRGGSRHREAPLVLLRLNADRAYAGQLQCSSSARWQTDRLEQDLEYRDAVGFATESTSRFCLPTRPRFELRPAGNCRFLCR